MAIARVITRPLPLHFKETNSHSNKRAAAVLPSIECPVISMAIENRPHPVNFVA
jgi:hypothetical protein